MKTKVTASNDTVLEVGKKYTREDWDEEQYITILAIGEAKIFSVDYTGLEEIWSINTDFLPYEEPKTKPFEGYQKWYVLYYDGTMMVKYGKSITQIKGSSMYIDAIYTEKEVKELGLKID